MTVFPSEFSTVGLSTTARWPPEARSANPIFCVVGKEMASTIRRTGNLVISLTFCEILAGERLRSRTFVAPMAFRCSVCFSEAVVMIGEIPDNFASWMSTFKELNRSHFQRPRRNPKKCVHSWPTELPPPRTTKGVSETFLSVNKLGGGIPSPSRT